MHPVPSFRTVVDALAHRGAAEPQRLAFATDAERTTYGQLSDEVSRLAAALAARGVAPGDRCALCLPTSLDFVRAFFAVQWRGAVPVPLSPDLPPSLLRRRAATARCATTIDADTIAGLREAARREQRHPRPSPDPSRTAYLLFTSGTTGAPRAAIILHRNLAAALRATHRLFALSDADVLAGWIPLHHTFGLARFVCTPVFSGCPCHLVPTSLTTLRRWLEVITEARATVTAASDFAYRAAALRVEAAGLDLTSLRYASSGGEPVRLDTIRRFEEKFGVPGRVRPGYGLTEATLAVASLPPGVALDLDSGGIAPCGPPVDGMALRIVGEEGIIAPGGTIGEIQVRGDAVFAGYDGDAADTAAAFDGEWLRTGDVGSVDERGWLTVMGREREMIKRGGVAIAPREIEDAAQMVQGIGRCAALGMRDARAGGDEVVLLAELSANVPAARAHDAARALSAAVAAFLGRPPNHVVVLPPDSLPVTPSGKVRTGDIRAALRGATPGEVFPQALALC